METSFTFRHLEATDAIREHARQKLTKLDKFLVRPVSAHFIFSVERFQHTAEINLASNGAHYTGSDTSTDLYASIDGAIDKLITQLKRDRERLKDHHRHD